MRAKHWLTVVVLALNHISAFGAFTGPSSEPYLSGDTWRHHVDYVLSDIERFRPEQVGTGDTIFVEQDSLREFERAFVPRIKSPYILITANCDRGGDEPIPGRYEKILDDVHLCAWFTQNLDRSDHPKLHPIPIGLANRKYPWGKIELYDEKIPESVQREKTKWVYVNFSIGTNPAVRQPCWDYFAYEFQGADLARSKDHPSYMQEVADYRFVVSPPGNGLDCHRTWEALLLGSYPIVLSSTLNPLYEDLPIVVVDSWEEVTTAMLVDRYLEFTKKEWSREKLYFAYWFDQVDRMQKKIRGQY